MYTDDYLIELEDSIVGFVKDHLGHDTEFEIFNILYTVDIETTDITSATVIWALKVGRQPGAPMDGLKLDMGFNITDYYKVYIKWASGITSAEVTSEGEVVALYRFDEEASEECKLDPVTEEVVQVNFVVTPSHPIPDSISEPFLALFSPGFVDPKLYAHKPYGTVVYFIISYDNPRARIRGSADSVSL